MTCAERQRDAAGLASLPASSSERQELEAHAAGCPACAAALARAEVLLAQLDSVLAPEPLSAEGLARGRRALDAAFAAEARRRPIAAGVAAIAVIAGFLLIGARDLARGELLVPLLTLTVAIATAVAASVARAAGPALVVAGLASVATAVMTGSGFFFEMGPGFACLAQELVTGAVAAGSLWLLDRRHGTRRSPLTWAAVASSGALAGQAGLLIHCHVTATGHGLSFHVAGVVLAGAMAFAASARRARA